MQPKEITFNCKQLIRPTSRPKPTTSYINRPTEGDNSSTQNYWLIYIISPPPKKDKFSS